MANLAQERDYSEDQKDLMLGDHLCFFFVLSGFLMLILKAFLVRVLKYQAGICVNEVH